MRKIVTASDSFKGSLSSVEVASTVESAAREVFPYCETVSVEIGDGGEGTSKAIAEALGGTKVELSVKGPLGNPVKAFYWITSKTAENQGSTAIMDMASASGITLVPESRLNPLKASTFGFGEMIADAVRKGCRRFFIGIGGSATNDAGIGMLTALGWRFLNDNGMRLPSSGASLEKIAEIDDSGVSPAIRECVFEVACDVDAPFTGPSGAVKVFAPQKGADASMIEILEKGMVSFSKVVSEKIGIEINNIPGSGAAGGLGGAFVAFLNANLRPGADLVLDVTGFNELASGADLVITGEGRIDSQTLTGKAPMAVLRRCQALGIPVIAVAGSIEDENAVKSLGFMEALCVNPPGTTKEEAMRPGVAQRNLRATIIKYLKTIN